MKTINKYNSNSKPKLVSAYRAALGFTLMELMIVLAIASIMMAVGAPSLVDTINRNAQVDAVNVFKSGISTARSNALIRKRPVVIEAMSGTDDWSTGFHIKFGTIANEESEIDTPFDDDTKIKITSTTGDEFLSFDRLGRVTPANSSFEICNQNTGKAMTIDVNIFGNAVVKKVGNNIQYSNCPQA